MIKKILNGITAGAVCSLLLFASGMDSGDQGVRICILGMAICIAWIAVYAKINPEYFKGED